MIPHYRARRRCGNAVLAMVCLFTLSSGCQLLDTRRTVDSYYEHDDMWCGNFQASFAQARVATLTALTELRMPVYKEGPLRQSIFIDTKTPDNYEVRLEIKPLGMRPDGETTRIGARVGGFGTHREVCARLLHAIAQRLSAAPPAPAFVPHVGLSGPPLPGHAPALQPAPPEASLPAQPVPTGSGR
jgi:hypothetical protein